MITFKEYIKESPEHIPKHAVNTGSGESTKIDHNNIEEKHPTIWGDKTKQNVRLEMRHE